MLRSEVAPVHYLSASPGMGKDTRRRMLDGLAKLNQLRADVYGDPEIETRIKQYEMAYRMQTSVPKLMDLGDEPESTFALYGPDARKRGSYAANCLLARRLVERGVRFVQLYKRGWDQHNDLPRDLALQCKAVGGAGSGSEAARVAGRHADRVGRRIRPHGVLPGRAHPDQLRARSSS